MNRQVILIAILVAVLVVAGWWMFLMSPQRAQLAEINDQIDAALAEQSVLQARIRTLQEVRAGAPQLEADIVAAETVIPRDAALPSAVRMLAQSADDSGVSLVSITPGRPSQLQLGPEGLAQITMAVALEGSYFQIVDFLRRVEDPAIVPRAILWEGLTLAVEEGEYPTLGGTLTGRMFAQLPAAPVAVVPDADTPAPTATESPTDGPSPTPSPSPEETP